MSGATRLQELRGLGLLEGRCASQALMLCRQRTQIRYEGTRFKGWRVAKACCSLSKRRHINNYIQLVHWL